MDRVLHQMRDDFGVADLPGTDARIRWFTMIFVHT
jgi:hypothetical protein